MSVFLRSKGEKSSFSKRVQVTLGSHPVLSNESRLRGILNFSRFVLADEHAYHSTARADASWFSTSRRGWIYRKFLSLRDLHDPSRGFLVNDTLIVEGEIKAVAAVTRFS
ncbi:hypothetical protein RHMOL_Rhmol09G0079200 [Rhododendron molle]|uniref:Uncharacterized protein n=1 Tax=Rhododendron molle TaxID=49168 RepID=A0ACC0MCA5_RHOML|nr:hypothetical protein RHMOL_Rhmol09G0079200 [Rhododendron molle]